MESRDRLSGTKRSPGTKWYLNPVHPLHSYREGETRALTCDFRLEVGRWQDRTADLFGVNEVASDLRCL
jgi:hypothetical protein